MEKQDFCINYTYLLECSDGTLYCGWTNHLDKRIKAHNEGKGAKYTKSRRPVHLRYYEMYTSKQEAMRREAAIKKFSRSEKWKLIQQREKDRNGELDETNRNKNEKKNMESYISN